MILEYVATIDIGGFTVNKYGACYLGVDTYDGGGNQMLHRYKISISVLESEIDQ